MNKTELEKNKRKRDRKIKDNAECVALIIISLLTILALFRFFYSTDAESGVANLKEININCSTTNLFASTFDGLYTKCDNTTYHCYKKYAKYEGRIKWNINYIWFCDEINSKNKYTFSYDHPFAEPVSVITVMYNDKLINGHYYKNIKTEEISTEFDVVK